MNPSMNNDFELLNSNELLTIDGGDFVDAIGVGVLGIGLVVGAIPTGALVVVVVVGAVLGVLDSHSW